MGYFKKEKGDKMQEVYVPKETLADVMQYKCLALPERGLTQQDAEFYGIRSAVSQEDGKTIEATYFPYYNKAGELT